MDDAEFDRVFFKGKGKSKGKRKGSGKGTGRRRNPIGADGNVMTCSICGSEEHFRAECPRNTNQGASSSQFMQTGVQAPHSSSASQAGSDRGPLSDLIAGFTGIVQEFAPNRRSRRGGQQQRQRERNIASLAQTRETNSNHV